MLNPPYAQFLHKLLLAGMVTDTELQGNRLAARGTFYLLSDLCSSISLSSTKFVTAALAATSTYTLSGLVSDWRSFLLTKTVNIAKWSKYC